MTRIEGQIKAIRQRGGCVEVTVSGPRSGTFTMNNCCAENIIANEGPTLVGRCVEYHDGYVRFRDSAEVLAEAEMNVQLRIAH